MSNVRLTKQQRRVVEHVDGPLLVVAGPGAGKTRVLTERVRRLLTEVPGHFRVLALTFTNKAANEMKVRLADLGDVRQRAFIGTLHGFCSDVLADRGKAVGVDATPQIFEQYQDRKQILLEAVHSDPFLLDTLNASGDAAARGKKIDNWLRCIAWVKAHPVSRATSDSALGVRVVEAYDAGLRACGAYDFDDLLLLTYRLFTEQPKVAAFYRRLYGYVCIDEAQDLNEAQYAVVSALCGGEFTNLMLVGDPKQAIYGFNTSSPDFMFRFRDEFNALEIELSENFRSSRAVVAVAKSLDSTYKVEGQLPIPGYVGVIVGADEADEAKQIADEIERLVALGHEDIEGKVTPARCAVLGRSRFSLLVIEKEFAARGIPHYKRLSPSRENESTITDEFQLALRVVANPKDQLHLRALAKKWGVVGPPPRQPTDGADAVTVLAELSLVADHVGAAVIVDALRAIARQGQRVDLMLGLRVLQTHADTLVDDERQAVHEDATVLAGEWDQYLRANAATRSISGFMSSLALGSTQGSSREGVALLTVHSSKGLEFDVVFVACMAEGTFPDYRAGNKAKELEEERRNVFVAVTRSMRLLYFSYPQRRMMPWGDEKRQDPSRYLRAAGLV